MIYYFVEFAGSFANIALLTLFVDRLFQKKDLSSRWLYLYIALLIAGQCIIKPVSHLGDAANDLHPAGRVSSGDAVL